MPEQASEKLFGGCVRVSLPFDAFSICDDPLTNGQHTVVPQHALLGTSSGDSVELHSHLVNGTGLRV